MVGRKKRKREQREHRRAEAQRGEGAPHVSKVHGLVDGQLFDPPSGYTIEGRIANTGRLARGLKYANPRQRAEVKRLTAYTAIAAMFIVLLSAIMNRILG